MMSRTATEPCVPDRDPDITHSDLSRTVSDNGVTVRVEIYRLASDRRWQLEVINEAGTSTVWDEPFDTDQAALEAFEQAVEEEGIETFLDNGEAETLH